MINKEIEEVGTLYRRLVSEESVGRYSSMGIDELRRIKGEEEIKDCQATMARYLVKRRSRAR